MSQDTTPSRLVRPTFLNHEQRQQREELRRVYNNQKCSCAENGAPGPGAPDFVEHSMFCQLYKCYVHDVGCCEGQPVLAAILVLT
ncbi:MAG: hypothetical protein SGPRY_003983 [Prymnesium sp.]